MLHVEYCKILKSSPTPPHRITPQRLCKHTFYNNDTNTLDKKKIPEEQIFDQQIFSLRLAENPVTR